ncbi:hypothetical protein BIY20_08670 [Vibrio panuliri]|uniref:Uncharacterized protein n=1 Tax=Vibrio panuliri TaxID=1381081 RepID=A0ABX3FHT9_9VIBR|nr:hypothetical protein BIY20_08670 [Vibrio panuliri]
MFETKFTKVFPRRYLLQKSENAQKLAFGAFLTQTAIFGESKVGKRICSKSVLLIKLPANRETVRH